MTIVTMHAPQTDLLVEAYEAAWRAYNEHRVCRYVLTLVTYAEASGGVLAFEPFTWPEDWDLWERTILRAAFSEAVADLQDHVDDLGPIETEDGWIYAIGGDGGLVRRSLRREPLHVYRPGRTTLCG